MTAPPVSYYVPHEKTSPKFAWAFAKGCGGTITDEAALFDGPVALFGSPARWPLLQQAQAEGRDWYYGDHGYFKPHRFYRVTKNAYQATGVAPATSERFDQLGRAFHVKSWRRAGSHVLVCPNSEVYFRLHGLEVREWLREVVTLLRAHTDRPIKVRWKAEARIRPIALDLEDCWAVVVFSSASALDALIAGIPVFVLAPFAAGARMGHADLTRIEDPQYPDDRERFLWALADAQWTIAELCRGEAWQRVQHAA